MRLVHEERRRGHESRLITLLSPMQKYEEDIALQLPALNLPQMKQLRRLVRGTAKTPIRNIRHEGDVKHWKPSNALDGALFRLRDALWLPGVKRTLEDLGGLESFDLIIADGGHDFTRFPQLLSQTTVPIVTMYYGSDMRTRGIISAVQGKAICTFTFEYDHTLLFPEAQFLLYPYQAPDYAPSVEYAPPSQHEAIRIGHAPTNRIGKGTAEILAALERIQSDFPVEIVMIENLPHAEALRRKATCHVFIDQIGELGYGVNALESLAMGIPTAVELMPDFEQFLEQHCGEPHPFALLRRTSLEADLRDILQNMSNWKSQGTIGQAWVRRHHSIHRIVGVYLGRIEEMLRK